MHDEEGPRRLRQGADTPDSLLRALTALRKGVDDSARLQRVGQQMEALLSSQPSAAQLTAGRGIFGQKLSGLKLILVIGGLGLLAPLLFFALMDDVTTVPPRDLEGSPLQKNAEKVEPLPSAQISPPVVAPVIETEAPVVPTEPATPDRATSKRAARSGHASSARPRKQRDRSHAEEATREGSEPIAKTDLSDAPIPTTQSTDPSVEPAPAPVAIPAARPQPKPAATQEVPRLSEAELLLKARQALKREPEQALRLAADHQAQHPNGRLTPEREVLAIEALRNLGRKAEADERLQKFEARYPGSIHLKRLREAR